jgi:hypothetical protein
LLSNEIFNEFVIIDYLVVINFCPAFKLHFLCQVLPFNFNLDQSQANKLQHLVRLTLEFHSNVECTLRRLLLWVTRRTKWVSRVHESLRGLVFLQIEPLFVTFGRLFIFLFHKIIYLLSFIFLVLYLSILVFIISIEPLFNFGESCEMVIAHG